MKSISDQSPLHLKAVALIGRCYLAVGRCTEAEGVFRYLHEKAPTDVDALKGLAAAHFDLGALPQALESCWKWAELEPASGPARRFEGVIYKEMQKFAEAVEPLRAALALGLPDEQRQEALAELATCHLETKQYAEAIEVLQQLPPAMARSTAAREIRAEALRNLGRSDEAAALLDALLRDHPHQLAPLRVRALVHFDQDQPRQAALLLEKAVVLAPRNQRLRVHLAQAYAALGENAKAAEQQGEAARLEKIVRELSDLTNHDLPNDYRNPALHERVAALYTELGLSQPAQRSRQIADMLRQNP
jgi:tetratricopeptide (TPR) repeat protein